MRLSRETEHESRTQFERISRRRRPEYTNGHIFHARSSSRVVVVVVVVENGWWFFEINPTSTSIKKANAFFKYYIINGRKSRVASAFGYCVNATTQGTLIWPSLAAKLHIPYQPFITQVVLGREAISIIVSNSTHKTTPIGGKYLDSEISYVFPVFHRPAWSGLLWFCFFLPQADYLPTYIFTRTFQISAASASANFMTNNARVSFSIKIVLRLVVHISSLTD